MKHGKPSRRPWPSDEQNKIKSPESDGFWKKSNIDICSVELDKKQLAAR